MKGACEDWKKAADLGDEEAGKLNESSDSKPVEEKEEAPKKKGLFGRKKKQIQIKG